MNSNCKDNWYNSKTLQPRVFILVYLFIHLSIFLSIHQSIYPSLFNVYLLQFIKIYIKRRARNEREVFTSYNYELTLTVILMMIRNQLWKRSLSIITSKSVKYELPDKLLEFLSTRNWIFVFTSRIYCSSL